MESVCRHSGYNYGYSYNNYRPSYSSSSYYRPSSYSSSSYYRPTYYRPTNNYQQPNYNTGGLNLGSLIGDLKYFKKLLTDPV